MEQEPETMLIEEPVFTSIGWTSREGEHLTCEMTLDGDQISYEMSSVSSPIFLHALFKPAKPVDVPTLGDVLALLLNISLGQRITTPEFQSQFIDRYDKTFFQMGTSLGYDFNQQNTTLISAIANYIHMTSNDNTVGTIEIIHDEYRYLIANIAYTLLFLLNQSDHDLRVAAVEGSTRKANIRRFEMSPETMEWLKSHIVDEDSALRFVDGCMACCCWKDHSVIGKDLANAKIREMLTHYQDLLTSAIWNEESTEPSCDILDMMMGFASNRPPHIWLIAEGTDEILDALAPEYAEHRAALLKTIQREDLDEQARAKSGEVKTTKTQAKTKTTRPKIKTEEERDHKGDAKKAGKELETKASKKKIGTKSGKSGTRCSKGTRSGEETEPSVPKKSKQEG